MYFFLSKSTFLFADVVDRGSNSSLSSLGETKNDTKITENEEAQSARELDLTLLWPYPQQLTLIKGNRYYPEAYLSIRILTHEGEGKSAPLP